MRRRIATILLSALAVACGPGDAPPAAPAAPVDVAAPLPPTDVPAAPLPASAAADPAPVIEQRVAYGEAEARNLTGFLAVPGDAVEPLPGLLIIHAGSEPSDDDVRALTRQLAGDGYVVLAVDLDAARTTAAEPVEAGARIASAAAASDARSANLLQAYDYLSTHALAPRVGVIGWSVGGAWALRLGLLQPELDAVVMYYGEVVTDRTELATLDAALLGIFAQRDEVILAADVARFRTVLQELGKQAEIRIYPGVAHAFASPAAAGYDAAAAAEAWQAAKAFLARRLQGE